MTRGALSEAIAAVLVVATGMVARVLPLIQECFEHHRFPRELVPELAAP